MRDFAHPWSHLPRFWSLVRSFLRGGSAPQAGSALWISTFRYRRNVRTTTEPSTGQWQAAGLPARSKLSHEGGSKLPHSTRLETVWCAHIAPVFMRRDAWTIASKEKRFGIATAFAI